MSDSLLRSPQAQQGVRQIVVPFAVIGIELQRLVVMSDGFIRFPFLEKADRDVVVSHPALRVFSNRRPPERVRIGIHFALLPGEKAEGGEQCGAKYRLENDSLTSQKFPGPR